MPFLRTSRKLHNTIEYRHLLNTLAVSSSLVVTVRWPSGENTALTTRLVCVPGFSRFGRGVLCGAAKTSVGSRIRVESENGFGALESAHGHRCRIRGLQNRSRVHRTPPRLFGGVRGK